MYRRNKHQWMKHLDFMLLDILCMHVTYILAYKMRHGMGSNLYANQFYVNILVCLSFSNIVVSLGVNTYKNVLKRGFLEECKATAKQAFLVVLMASGYLFVIKEGSTASRFVLLSTGGLYLVVALLAREAWKQYLRRRMAKLKSRSLLIVTTSDRAEETIAQMKVGGLSSYYIAGLVLVDSEEIQQEISGVQVVASKENAAEYVCREWVDEVMIDMPNIDEVPQDLMDEFMEMGVVVHIVVSGIFNPYGQSQFVERIGGKTVLTSSIKSVDSFQIFMKRMMDVIIGLVGSAVCILLTMIVGPMIYIASPGPIFFKQTRVGKNGKKFQMYKFRSMYLDAEERKAELMEQNNVKDGMMFKLDYDPRIIGCKKREDGTIQKGLGNYIRDWSIDEFPQFLNILKGDMSCVGTRPPTVDEWEKYELHHRQRLAIKPGLTGLWQVSGRSNITNFEEVVKLDAQYIANWSLEEDIRILFKTVGVVLKRVGAK